MQITSDSNYKSVNESYLKSVLITDFVHHKLITGFEELGFHCDYLPKSSLKKVKEIIQNYEGVIINSKIIVDETFLDKAVRLKFIGRLGSGMEIINQPYARQKGVAVFSAPEGNCNAVAEHALGMLLALANNFRKGDQEVRAMIWQREANRGFELMGKTVGIIGFGHTGNHFAKKLSGLGVKVLAYDKYKPEGYALDYGFVTETNEAQIFEEADIVSLHLPLNPETKHYANWNWIQQFSKSITIKKHMKVIIIEDEKPLTFTENEKKVFNRLYDFENVILTPHVAGWTTESLERLAMVLLQKISHFLKENKI